MDDIKNPQAKKMKKAPIQPQDKNVSYIKQVRRMLELQVQSMTL